MSRPSFAVSHRSRIVSLARARASLARRSRVAHLPRITLRYRRRHRHRSPLSLHLARDSLQLAHAMPQLPSQRVVPRAPARTARVSVSLLSLHATQTFLDVETQSSGDGVEVIQGRHRPSSTVRAPLTPRTRPRPRLSRHRSLELELFSHWYIFQSSHSRRSSRTAPHEETRASSDFGRARRNDRDASSSARSDSARGVVVGEPSPWCSTLNKRSETI